MRTEFLERFISVRLQFSRANGLLLAETVGKSVRKCYIISYLITDVGLTFMLNFRQLLVDIHNVKLNAFLVFDLIGEND